MPTNDSVRGSLLRNPLTVFGLILVAGDGPLVVAFGLANESWIRNTLGISLVLFVWAMAGVFCWFLRFHPELLYCPRDFPPKWKEKDIFGPSIGLKDAQMALERVAEDVGNKAMEIMSAKADIPPERKADIRDALDVSAKLLAQEETVALVRGTLTSYVIRCNPDDKRGTIIFVPFDLLRKEGVPFAQDILVEALTGLQADGLINVWSTTKEGVYITT